MFDDSASYQKALENGTLWDAIKNQLVNEVQEEADILAKDFRLLKKSVNGLTVEWDIYFFIVDQFQVLESFYSGKEQKSEYEYINHTWLSYSDALKLCVEGKVSEDRSASILMRFLLQALDDTSNLR